MLAERILLIITAAIAVMALAVAVIALLRLRKIAERPEPTVSGDLLPAQTSQPVSASIVPSRYEPLPADAASPRVEIVDDAVIVRPSNQQIVEATMGHSLVRFNIVLSGLAYALRPESRDRIRGLMRREFKARKALRQRHARRAARAVPAANSSRQVWVSSDDVPERPKVKELES